MTFPDGSHIGPLVVSPVHNDRLLMVPPGSSGSFMTVGWTIQHTGARFDPPIQVKIPNTTGMKPGETNEIVQWDHDLATFVPMGHGTISEDGTLLVSDIGSGITKAGWGGGPPPVPPNDGDGECDDRRADGICGCTGISGPVMRPRWQTDPVTEPEAIVIGGNPLVGYTKQIDKFSDVKTKVECERICRGGEYKWRIKGGLDILLLDYTRGWMRSRTASNRPLANGDLVVRLEDYIEHTPGHQAMHRNACEKVRDRYHTSLDGEESSLRSCQAKITQADSALVSDVNTVGTSEDCHNSEQWVGKPVWQFHPTESLKGFSLEGYPPGNYTGACVGDL